MMASESVALKQNDFRNFVDILPGQAVIIEKGKSPVFCRIEEQKRYAPDIFEFCYFARPDSIIDGISVNQSRENMGYKLADKIAKILPPAEIKEIDVVIPIPETSNTSAPCVAEGLMRRYYQGFVKNRYVFRTFIMPGQEARLRGVKRKLNPMDEKFKDKNVLLIDDSIVRGTTSREIVSMARAAGAKKVYFASCAPPITHAHIYGIDLASPSELIAHEQGHDRAIESIARHIGADRVIFQDLDDLKDACSDAVVTKTDPHEPRDFEVGVFCGKYVTPVPPGYFKHIERVREKSKRMKVLEKARKAVASGHADRMEMELVSNGVEAAQRGEVVSGLNGDPGHFATTAGTGSSKRHKQSQDEETVPKDQMDISLHNFGDY